MVKDTFYELLDTSWPTVVLFLVIICLFRIFYYRNSGRKFIIHENLVELVFITYILLLFELVTSRDTFTTSGYNLVPFREILRYTFGSDNFYKQVLGNIIIFIPFGWFATNYTKINRISKISILTFLVSLTIEIVQKYIGRSFDIDDIILNVMGGILGFFLYTALDAIRKKLPGMFSSDWFLSLLSIILLLFGILYMLGYVVL